MLLDPLDLAYIPIVALFNVGLIYFYHLKINKRRVSGKGNWAIHFIISFFNTWGIDTLHHLTNSSSWMDAFKIALGAWLLFTAATSYKYYRFDSLPFKKFWLDYGGDLLSYMFISASVYTLT